MPTKHNTPRVPVVVVGAVLTAVPAAWLLESILRALLFPPGFDAVREGLRPTLYGPAMTLTGVAVLLSLIAVPRARARLAALRRAVPPPDEDRPDGPLSPEARSEETSRALSVPYFLWATLVQAPAVIGTLLFLFGAPFGPTLATVVVSTGAILAIGR